jgi:hypothetical protein
MRYVMFGLWLAASLAVGADTDESTPGESEAQVAESQEIAEEEVDAEISRIEKGVSGEDDVKEFVPKKPLSADKAIALPSDI